MRDMRLTPTEQQQHEMRHAYYDGAPGILVSGFVWVLAALVCYQLGINKAIWTLLIGGALIHPIGIGVAKALGQPRINKTNRTKTINFELPWNTP